MTRRYFANFIQDKDAVTRDCVSYHAGVFPAECFLDGFVMHYGQRVEQSDFYKWAKTFRSRK